MLNTFTTRRFQCHESLAALSAITHVFYMTLTPLDSKQLKYGYEGYWQFPLPRDQVNFCGGAAEGNKHGRGGMVTACITK